MDCEYIEYYEGYQTYSARVPGYAQGAYFPGDDPGWKCSKDGEYCLAREENDVRICHRAEETDNLCPECLENGHNNCLNKSPDSEVLFCKTCGKIYDPEDVDIHGLIQNAADELCNKYQVQKLELERLKRQAKDMLERSLL